MATVSSFLLMSEERSYFRWLLMVFGSGQIINKGRT